MSPLIDRERRDRNRRARAERRARIVEAARHCFGKLPYTQVTLEAVGQRAKVKEGLPALFFRTREELFLEVLRAELRDWFEALSAVLAAEDGPVAPAGLALLLAGSVFERPLLTRQLSLLHLVLEQDVDQTASASLGVAFRSGKDEVGEALERRAPWLEAGSGAVLLRRLVALVAGLEPLGRPSGMAQVALADSNLAGLKVDFDAELEAVLELMLTGWYHGSSATGRTP